MKRRELLQSIALSFTLSPICAALFRSDEVNIDEVLRCLNAGRVIPEADLRVTRVISNILDAMNCTDSDCIRISPHDFFDIRLTLGRRSDDAVQSMSVIGVGEASGPSGADRAIRAAEAAIIDIKRQLMLVSETPFGRMREMPEASRF